VQVRVELSRVAKIRSMPLHSERYGIMMRKRTAELAEVKVFLDVRQSPLLRRKLEALAGMIRQPQALVLREAFTPALVGHVSAQAFSPAALVMVFVGGVADARTHFQIPAYQAYPPSGDAEPRPFCRIFSGCR
jgi:hypothetical protein